MRDYAKLAPTFWTGETGKQLRRRGSEAVIVALYLVSSPHSNMLGLYFQAVPYIGYETGLGEEGARKGLSACIEVGFCSYDPDTEMVWVHEMAAWQVAEELKATDKRCKGIQKDYESLPNCPFIEPFFERYAQSFHLTKRRQSPGLRPPPPQGPSQGPSQAPSKPGAGAGAGTGAGTGAGESDPSDPPSTPVGVDPARPKGDDRPVLTLAAPSPRTDPPDCPHLAVLALWAELLPQLPQHLPERWTGARADHLRTRWRECAVERGWRTQADGLAYFGKLFRWIGRSDWLCGRGKTPPGKRPFVIELEWLVNPSNFAKVVEGKYHDTPPVAAVANAAGATA